MEPGPHRHGGVSTEAAGVALCCRDSQPHSASPWNTIAAVFCITGNCNVILNLLVYEKKKKINKLSSYSWWIPALPCSPTHTHSPQPKVLNTQWQVSVALTPSCPVLYGKWCQGFGGDLFPIWRAKPLPFLRVDPIFSLQRWIKS